LEIIYSMNLQNYYGLINKGIEANRPTPPVEGFVYYNTTLDVFEWYDGTQWITCANTRRSNEVTQTFTSSTTFVVPAGITNIAEVLVVAGGGGGGGTFGGGGGAGGVLYATNFLVTPGASLTVTVGAGGTGGRGFGNGTQQVSATNGGNSVFGSLNAIGGGFGGQYPNFNAGSGGSGGGSDDSGSGGTGTVGQGFNGGLGSTNVGGGGGGAGSPGANSAGATLGANGGIGRPNPIVGSTAGQLVSGVYYLGGGGGSGGTGTSSGLGGFGGGGNGISVGNGISGTANTGGGGGSSWNNGYQAVQGGNGGSGIVIIKY
jgi:hypothetical protein